MAGPKKEDVDFLKASGAFNETWYRSAYPDVDMVGMDPVEHYLWIGAVLNRDPNPSFSTREYKVAYPDLDSHALNPFVHFIRYGTKTADAHLPPVDFFKDSDKGACEYFSPPEHMPPFDAWKRMNRATRFRSESIKQAVLDLEAKLKFTVVVPVFNPPLEVMRECIESVLGQSYRNFELILVDDKSTDERVSPFLRSFARKHREVQVIERTKNGHISAATNDGVDAASGEYIVLLDNDDALDPDALGVIAAHIAKEPDVEFLYSDDAKFKTDQSDLFGPKFKPGWSPELLLSYCYVSHVKVLKRELYLSVGGCRSELDGSQDHDLVLRATERTNKVSHIPQILYRRRVLPGSTASSGHAKPYTFEAGRRACEEAFIRRNLQCTVVHPQWAFERGLGVFVPQMPDDGPEVTLVIPTRNNWKILDRLLLSLQKTAYRNFSVLIVDNYSDDPETVRYLKSCPHRVIRVASPNGKFNFSNLNNQAVKAVSTEFVLFLNDDTEVVDGRWLSQMVGWGQLDGVGAVGARLLFGDGRVQHGGIVPSLPWRVGRTAFRGLPGSDLGYLLLPRVTRNCAAVTAACMLTRRDEFLSIGGFDEQQFGVAYNDIDYCMRLRESGKRIVYCGEAELFHHEGTSRGKTDAYQEIVDYAAKWGNVIDPYFNPNLDEQSNRFEIKGKVVPPVKLARPVKVLAITHNLRTEGAPNSAYEIMAGLSDDSRFEISVASPVDGPLREVYEKRGISVDVLEPEYSLTRNLGSYDELVTKVAERLRMSSFDVVYANTAEMFWMIEAASLAGVPCLWNIRESESWKTYYDRFGPEIGKRALQAFSIPYRTIFVANSTRKRWAALDTVGNSHVITNGIDPRRFKKTEDPEFRAESRRLLGIANDEVVLLTMGTVSARKCQHELIEGFAKLPERLQKKAKLFIVGSRPSPYLEYVKALAASKSHIPSDAIQIIPETRDTGAYWASADIFVFASRMESYPRVILEAMVHQLPIISTPTYGIAEQVREGVNARLYVPGRTDELAVHMQKLIEDKGLRGEMGVAGLKVLQGLTSYSQMVELYKEQFIAAAFSAAN